ncbi:MAG: hypothetical protein AAB529_02030 [Patescibacteria group bacterium]
MQAEAYSDLPVIDVDCTMPIDSLISLMRDSFARVFGDSLKISVDKDINERNFPSAKSRQRVKRATAFSLLPLCPREEGRREKISSLRVIEKMSRQNRDPADIRDFLYFAIRCPEIAAENTMVVLGSVLVAEIPESEKQAREGFKSVPFFTKRGKRFCLDLLWFKIDWPGGCKFLAKDKEQSAQFLCFSS